jgi:hypothetical protein
MVHGTTDIKFNFLDWFSKNTQTSNFMKIRPVGAELFHADGRTDMTKLIVAFRSFADAPKVDIYIQHIAHKTSVHTSLWKTPSFGKTNKLILHQGTADILLWELYGKEIYWPSAGCGTYCYRWALMVRLNTYEEQTRQQRHTKTILNELKFES